MKNKKLKIKNIPRIAILTSSTGGLLKAVIEAVENKKISINIVKVLSDRNCPAIEVAKNFGLDTAVIERKTRIERDREFITILEPMKIDFILLCGYFRILTPEFIYAYPDRILNSHPSLLPEFPGIDEDVYRQVLEAKKQYTGVTVHLVDEHVDHGRILGQAKVKIENGDTIESLRNRVKAIENDFFPKVCERFFKTNDDIRTTRNELCVES